VYNKLDFHQTFIIEGEILNSCGPLFFSRSSELLPTNIVANGSFGLINTGERDLLVTCCHVVNDFDAEKAHNPEFQMGVLLGRGYPVPLDRAVLVDSDPRLDLATFDMAPLLPHCSARRFYPIHTNQPPALKPDDILAFVGYIGEYRAAVASGANFGYQSFGLSVGDVSGFRIAADITGSEWAADPHGAHLPPAKSLGGISGAPVFQFTVKASLRLVAFATEEGLGLVRMTHANRIRPDGTLIKEL
jgi:hypothetical protein